jgi:hypothetical protein
MGSSPSYSSAPPPTDKVSITPTVTAARGAGVDPLQGLRVGQGSSNSSVLGSNPLGSPTRTSGAQPYSSGTLGSGRL